MIIGKFIWQTSRPHHAHVVWCPNEGSLQAIIGRDLPFEEAKLITGKLNAECRYVNALIENFEDEDEEDHG